MARIITDYLDQAAARFPDKTAFADPQRCVTFSEAQKESQAVASGLIRTGLFRKPAAIFLDKGINCITCMLGVAYSGNFYTVMDTKMPSGRIEKILDTLKPACLITDTEHFAQAQEIAGGIPLLLFEELSANDADTEMVAQAGRRILASDILYVLFTSGSTGVPKGVITPHYAVVNYMEAVSEALHLNEKTVFCSQTPFYFVMSIVDIFATIRNGACLHIVPQMYFSFPALLMKYIEEHQVNTLYWVPSALNMIANLNAFDCADITCVKSVIFGGEVMPVKQLKQWQQALPEAVFINSYGPTEGTDGTTYYVVNREFADNERLPIGIAFSNSEILVLDENDRPVTGKGMGEFCIRSTSLTYGYFNNPEKTAEVYVRNPLNPYVDETIYRTGDLVEWNAFGELEYAGRKDFQIKHMGHRIELGEIEANASAIEGVEEVCCLYHGQKKQIRMFYSGKTDEKEVKDALSKMVPDYMVPARVIRLKVMPHNLNGKIDRAQLKKQMEEV